MNPSPQPATVSPPARRRRPGQALMFIAAAVFLAFALPLTFLAGLLAWHQYRVFTTWPMVEAVVTKAEWTSSDAVGGPGSSYGASFTFRYTAAGRVYSTSSDLGYTAAQRADVENWMKQLPVGSHRKLRYDPANPANITLVTDFSARAFTAPLMLARWAGIIAAGCVIAFVLGWRAGKTRDSGGGRKAGS